MGRKDWGGKGSGEKERRGAKGWKQRTATGGLIITKHMLWYSITALTESAQPVDYKKSPALPGVSIGFFTT